MGEQINNPYEALIGNSASMEHTVGSKDTALAWGNELEVLATPILLWLAEISCMHVLQGKLQEDEMTLGVGHDSKHLAATPLGQRITLTAILESVEGKMMRFKVTAHDPLDLIFEGHHIRGIVKRDKFLDRLARKSQSFNSTGDQYA